jgi:hypothetical protein
MTTTQTPSEDVLERLEELHAGFDRLWHTVSTIQEQREDQALAGGGDHLAILDDTVAELAAELQRQKAALDALAEKKKQETDPLYGTLHAWVAEQFLPTWERELGADTRWCAQWWAHPEAVYELEAMWRAWEHARHNGPTGHAAWIQHTLIPVGGLLTGGQGPFSACDGKRGQANHVPNEAAAVEAPPAELIIHWKKPPDQTAPPTGKPRRRRAPARPRDAVPTAAPAMNGEEATHE